MAAGTGTALAIAGLATTAISTGMSFAQANKQKKLQEEAQREADKYMAEAREKLSVNYYDQLSVLKEPYELEREALLASGAQAIDAAMEGGRNVAATAGRVQMAQQEGQREIATAMSREAQALEQASVSEDAAIAKRLSELDLGEVAGAQSAMRDAEASRQRALQSGVEGILSMGMQGVAMSPLYKKQGGINVGTQENIGGGGAESAPVVGRINTLKGRPDYIKNLQQQQQLQNQFTPIWWD